MTTPPPPAAASKADEGQAEHLPVAGRVRPLPLIAGLLAAALGLAAAARYGSAPFAFAMLVVFSLLAFGTVRAIGEREDARKRAEKSFANATDGGQQVLRPGARHDGHRGRQRVFRAYESGP